MRCGSFGPKPPLACLTANVCFVPHPGCSAAGHRSHHAAHRYHGWICDRSLRHVRLLQVRATTEMINTTVLNALFTWRDLILGVNQPIVSSTMQLRYEGRMFTVHPEEIKDFTGDQLVALLRRLLYAEARKAGVPLRGVEVPLQITVADGGQDGSIFWDGGNASTDYLPGRDIVFQCKAKDKGDAQWKSEVWTKPTKKSCEKDKKLSDAVKGVLDRGGAYIGITA